MSTKRHPASFAPTALRWRISVGDGVACIPLMCVAALLVFGFLVDLEIDAAGAHSPPAPETLTFLGLKIAGLMRLFIHFAAIPVSFLAVAAVGMSALLHTLGDLAEFHWEFVRHLRHISRLVVSGAGLFLLCSLLGPLLSWLMD